MKKRNPYRIAAIIVLILVVIFFAISIYQFNYLEGRITESVEKFGLASVGFFSFVLDLIPQYLSPHIFIIASKFIGFNISNILVFVIVGSTIGSLVGFEIGNKLEQGDLLIDFIGKKKANMFKHGINKKGRWIVSLAAISPIPYIPLILGMFCMSRRNFILFGILPRIMGFVVLGLIFL